MTLLPTSSPFLSTLLVYGSSPLKAFAKEKPQTMSVVFPSCISHFLRLIWCIMRALTFGLSESSPVLKNGSRLNFRRSAKISTFLPARCCSSAKMSPSECLSNGPHTKSSTFFSRSASSGTVWERTSMQALSASFKRWRILLSLSRCTITGSTRFSLREERDIQGNKGTRFQSL